MHKYMMAALFALVFAIPGMAKVHNASASTDFELRRTNSIPAQATAPPTGSLEISLKLGDSELVQLTTDLLRRILKSSQDDEEDDDKVDPMLV